VVRDDEDAGPQGDAARVGRDVRQQSQGVEIDLELLRPGSIGGAWAWRFRRERVKEAITHPTSCRSPIPRPVGPRAPKPPDRPQDRLEAV